MSIQSLNIALSGLKATQNAINTTANNISNASTEGYTRKILPQQADFAGDTPLGVRISEVIRKVDLSLVRSLTEQRSSIEALSVRDKFLSRIQAFHGPSEAEQSIGAILNGLKEDFITLSSEPENPILIDKVITQATQTASKFNDFSDLILQLRNDSQSEITVAISEVNSALQTIANINKQVGGLSGAGRSIANLLDQRDVALGVVSKNLDISFFTMENDKITVMTKSGQILADEEARELVFNPVSLLPGSFHPGGGAAGIFIDSTSGVEITNTPFNGRIGELINLRDTTLPQYQSQLDELAQKTAIRFEEQGLKLFTDEVGNVPPSVTPPAAVNYVGFAARIQVNNAVLADHSLIRSGTGGATVLEGSNSIIRKITDFTFGNSSSLQGTGNVDVSAGTIFASTGLTQTGQVIGSVNIAALTTLDSDPNITAGDQFTIDDGTGAQLITINPADTATDIVNNINAVLPGAARLNGLGQLILEGTGNITITDVSIGAAGIAALGHNFGVTAAKNPSFTVQAGTNNPVTVTINPADTSATILATLNAIPDITASLNGAGELQINTVNGGDLTLTDTFDNPLVGFGISLNGVNHTAFRQNNLGPNADVSTQLINFSNLVDYAQGIVNLQSEVHSNTVNELESDTIFFNSLEQRFLNESGVDIDQEVANLVQLQNAYAASARAISVSEQLFNTLLDAFR